jgi:hypothetical protein
MEETNRPTHESTAPDQAPWHSRSELDPTVPHAARVYDYFLGGSEWFPVDRVFAEKVMAAAPWVIPGARENKKFLSRAVRFLSEQGVRQFIDIGCGLPHKDLTHEIAWQVSPWAKTLYVDYEPLVVQRMNNAIDAVDPAHKYLSVMQADIREVDVILGSEETRLLIDFSEPVGLLVMATLHFLGPGDDPVGLMARYRDSLPTGSFFAASHATQDGVPPDSVLDQTEKAGRLWASSRNPAYYRTRSEFRELFDGWDLVDPGIVWVSEWRAGTTPAIDGPETAVLAGVGKK